MVGIMEESNLIKKIHTFVNFHNGIFILEAGSLISNEHDLG
jgi:hypothetical protein